MFATTIELGLCNDPECRSVHFKLLDKHGHPFAMAILGIEELPSLIEELHALAYEIAANKEPQR